MREDSVLLEVRAAREAFAQSHGYNVRAMVADLRAQDELGDWLVVRLTPRRPVATVATQSGHKLGPQMTQSTDAPTNRT